MRLLNYIQGFRKGKEAHRLEKEAMSDPFLADAIDGYTSTEGNQEQRIEELRRRIRVKSSRKKNYAAVWSMAASLLIGVCVGGYFMFQKNTRTELSREIALENQHQSPPVPQEEDALANMIREDTQKITASPLISGNRERKTQAAAPLPEGALQAHQEDMMIVEESMADEIAVIEPAVGEINMERDTSLKISDVRVLASIGEVHGKVTDLDGEPIVGASVIVKGTNKGTITDLDGNFALNADGQKELIVNFIGYDSVVLAADTTAEMLIAMNEDTRAFDEVVVIGYSAQKKNKITGSVQVQNFSGKPQPVMGMRAFKKYLKENLIRPKDQDCAQTKGKVILSFHVNEEGRPEKITVKKGLCPVLDIEAIRLIEEGPDWTAGGEAAEITIRF